ncbi:GNAT family N-acetyltransferase [Planomicrobium sp. CPCC 101079]|nr:GNAT family N-acetyltransferase [Planomicrobium sp. CPCC 101079]
MWAIQIPAYRIEAELIGFDGIPPLKETVEDIQKSDETFIGFFEDELKGFISYKQEKKLIDIHRLVIHPDSFRQGIASKLITFLLSEFPGYKFIVTTGQANIPAKKLYVSLGFVEQKDFEVAPGIWCTELRLNN